MDVTENFAIMRFVICPRHYILRGTTVAQWLRCCAKKRKVSSSIPDGVMEFFIDIILPVALWLWGRIGL